MLARISLIGGNSSRNVSTRFIVLLGLIYAKFVHLIVDLCFLVRKT